MPRDLEDFFTPFSISEWMVGKIDESGPFIEPCAGDGSILRYLPQGTLAFDVCPRAEGIIRTRNSLLEDWQGRICVTNPPFSKAKEFIDKALESSDVCYFILPPCRLTTKRRYSYLYIEKLWFFFSGETRASKLPFLHYSDNQKRIDEFACFAKIRKVRVGETSNWGLIKTGNWDHPNTVKLWNTTAVIMPRFGKVLKVRFPPGAAWRSQGNLID